MILRRARTLGVIFAAAGAIAVTSRAGARGDEGPGASEVAAVVSLDASGLAFLDLEGKVHATSGRADARPLALVFVSLEGEASRAALPKIGAFARARSADIEIVGVVSDGHLKRAQAVDLAKAAGASFPIGFDASGELAQRLRPRALPEAYLLDLHGNVVFRGKFGASKEGEGSLALALSDVLASRPVALPVSSPEGDAVASVISALPTYSREVAPIFAARCADCHHSGAVAPFALTSFAEAQKHARTIARATGSRYMPPWHAAPRFGDFADERRLTDREIQVLGQWAAADSPEGDARDLPPTPSFAGGWQLGQPDAVLEMSRAFDVPSSGKDVYRAFVFPLALPDDHMVVASEFQPGAPSVVHHCISFIDAKREGRALEARSGEPGYPATFMPGFVPLGQLGEWAPGTRPCFLPEGMGRPFPKGSDVVAIVHYHPNGKAEQDRSRIGLYFAKKTCKQTVESVPLWQNEIDIAAGDAHYKRTCGLTLPVPATLVGVLPHMHLVGREMKVIAKTPREELLPLVWIKDWDFRWQDNYHYARPLRLDIDTRFELEAYYDNSAENPQNPSNPPRRVRTGEKTTDEMCLCFLTLAVDDPADLWLVRGAVEAERLAERQRARKRAR